MKKLLVTGISGFLGWHVATANQKDWTITGLYHHNKIAMAGVNLMQCDLTNKEAVSKLVSQLQPDAILHLAANSNANFCEQNPEISHAINVEATAHLANLANELSIPFLFTSTDLVFDGTAAPYDETHQTNAISVYGQHKVEAEQAIMSLHPYAIIARMPLMYGLADYADSFASHWLRKLRNGEVVYAFTDEYRTALSGRDAAKALFLLLEKKVKAIWHLGGKERLSRYDFAIQMAQQFDLDTSLIKPSLQSDVTMPAKRPPDVSLDSGKAMELGFNPDSTVEALFLMKSDS